MGHGVGCLGWLPYGAWDGFMWDMGWLSCGTWGMCDVMWDMEWDAMWDMGWDAMWNIYGRSDAMWDMGIWSGMLCLTKDGMFYMWDMGWDVMFDKGWDVMWVHRVGCHV